MTERAKKMSHTPGPWFQSSTVLVCSGDAEVIANCTPLVDVPALSIPLNQVDANARLIAAAPDLLDALVGMVRIVKPAGEPGVRCPHPSRDIGTINAAIVAIKKARGQ